MSDTHDRKCVVRDDAAFVPSWRLREESEEKRKAIAQCDALRAERDALIVEREKSRQRVHSLKQASHQIGVTPRQTRRLIAAGKIKAVRIGLRRLGISSEEIERVIAEGIG